MEELEWEFQNEKERDKLQISNRNRSLKNISASASGSDIVRIKLKNKTIDNDREYRVTLKSGIDDYNWLSIGVCDLDWKKELCYDHSYGNIEDNSKEIKALIEPNSQNRAKLKCGDYFEIKDLCIGKIANNNVHKVSMNKNGDEVLTSFYCQQQRKDLYLLIGSKMQLEVDVKGNISTKLLNANFVK